MTHSTNPFMQNEIKYNTFLLICLNTLKAFIKIFVVEFIISSMYIVKYVLQKFVWKIKKYYIISYNRKGKYMRYKKLKTHWSRGDNHLFHNFM